MIMMVGRAKSKVWKVRSNEMIYCEKLSEVNAKMKLPKFGDLNLKNCPLMYLL